MTTGSTLPSRRTSREGTTALIALQMARLGREIPALGPISTRMADRACELERGTTTIKSAEAPVLSSDPRRPTLYIAGDTIWCDEVREAVDRHHPDVIVANAGGARFLEGDPITMTADDVVASARHATDARIIVVHLEAVNHCLETRADLRARLHHEQLQERVSVPDDGDELLLP